uniref:DUF1713 domain-containing protein n=1 Tax=Strongyloides papillosus TaxID=174720 RepID=A0A0N5C8Q2_STREA
MLKSKFSNCHSIIRNDISKAINDSNNSSNSLKLSDSINHNKLYLKHGQKIKNYSPSIWKIDKQIRILRRLKARMKILERRRKRLSRIRRRRLSLDIISLIKYRLRLEKNQAGQINRDPGGEFSSTSQNRINKVRKFTDKTEDDETYIDEELDSDESYEYEYE